MKCPVCQKVTHACVSLNAEGFHEDIFECPVCESSWSMNHGHAEIVNDTQRASFMEGTTEPVENDDYCFAL